MEPSSLKVGQRLLINSERCTVLWIGKLPNLPYERLGIEWDTVSRGKHSGEFEGKRYFVPRISLAASFVKRPQKLLEREGTVQVGIRLLVAIKERYLGTLVEDIQVPLASQPRVKIETRGWEQVQKKLGQTSQLRVVSVSDTLVSSIDAGSEVRQLLPVLEELDLSRTLISAWPALMQLCAGYVTLTTLRLDGNRFRPIGFDFNTKHSFENLVTLTLNSCLFTNSAVNDLAPYLTKIKILQLSSNQLTLVPSPFDTELPWFPSLETLILSDNLITGSNQDSLSGLKYYTSLQYLDLSNNPLSHFDTCANSTSLQRLNINYGKVSEWREFGKLPSLFPYLNHLQALENPAVVDPSSLVDVKIAIGGSVSISRITLIAMIPTLNQLNMSTVSTQERTDAELFYLNQICQPKLACSETCLESFKQTHVQYERLCALYDVSHNVTKPTFTKPVKDRLLNLRLVLHNVPPPTQSNTVSTEKFLQLTPIQQSQKQFLRSANLRTLQLSVLKLFNLKPGTQIDLYGLLPYTDPQQVNPDVTIATFQVIKLDNPVRQLHHFYQLNDQDLVWVALK